MNAVQGTGACRRWHSPEAICSFPTPPALPPAFSFPTPPALHPTFTILIDSLAANAEAHSSPAHARRHAGLRLRGLPVHARRQAGIRLRGRLYRACSSVWRCWRGKARSWQQSLSCYAKGEPAHIEFMSFAGYMAIKCISAYTHTHSIC